MTVGDTLATHVKLIRGTDCKSTSHFSRGHLFFREHFSLVNLHQIENLRTEIVQLKGPLRSVILGSFAKLRKATIRFVMPDFKVVHSVHFFTSKFVVCYTKIMRLVIIINGVLRHVCLSICSSARNHLSPTGLIFMKFDI